jgi:GGDEF domain-containing protein
MIAKGKSISHGTAALEYDLAKQIAGKDAATEVCRNGLYGTTGADMVQVMKPIQKNSEIPVSASVGYAVGKYENIMELIEIADQRMYKDKQIRRQ